MDRRSLLIPSAVCLKQLKKLPYKRMKFITIKDNTQTKLVKVGQAFDYLKRFSQNIWIVKSPKGGIHFHAFIVLKEGKKMSFKKGIHIRVDPVGGEKPLKWDPEQSEDKLQDAADMALEAFDLTGDQDHANEIYDQVLEKPSKEYLRICRRLLLSKKEKHILNIFQYLNKNLLENPLPIGRKFYDRFDHYMVRDTMP